MKNKSFVIYVREIPDKEDKDAAKTSDQYFFAAFSLIILEVRFLERIKNVGFSVGLSVKIK